MTLRLGLVVFSLVLALLSVWLLATEIVRPEIPYFPVEKAAADAAGHRGRAAVAASIGAIRGELWVDYATLLSSDLLADLEGLKATARPKAADNVGATASKAASLAPYDSRIWLLLALIQSRLDGPDRAVAELLKMSYYTGPNQTDLVPPRLLVATQSAAVANPELRDLVSRDVRTIVAHRPELRSALFVAYRSASPDGKRFLDAEIGSLDQNLLSTVRAGGPLR